MTAEPRCVLSDLPVSSCGHCNGAEQRALAEARACPPGTTVTARFPGRCLACDEPVAPGDVITADQDGHGWLHQHCAA